MQTRLALLSNAGGSGKTTLATHLAYTLGSKGLSVLIIDLDPQGSVSLFCGLDDPEEDQTLSAVLRDDFDGNWPFISLWSDRVKNVQAIRGDLNLVQSQNELVLNARGAYLLADRLQDFPVEHDVIIFDCPATLGALPQIAISASTHLLVPLQVEPKSTSGAGKLLEWFYATVRQLRLNPEPELLGIVPNQYDQRIAIHRNILEELTPQLDALGINCFSPIRFSSEFKNASARGLPLHSVRPGHSACKDFAPITDAILSAVGAVAHA